MAKAGSGPRAVGVRVTAGHRVTIPREIQQLVPWLSVSSVPMDCELVWLESVDGFEIAHAGSERSLTSIGDDSALDERQQWRIRASRFPLKIEAQGKASLRFTIPDVVRKMGMLPEEGGTVLLFACEDVLEIWKPESWYRNLLSMCPGTGPSTTSLSVDHGSSTP